MKLLYIITLSIYCYYSTIYEAVFVSRFTTRKTRDHSLSDNFQMLKSYKYCSRKRSADLPSNPYASHSVCSDIASRALFPEGLSSS